MASQEGTMMTEVEQLAQILFFFFEMPSGGGMEALMAVKTTELSSRVAPPSPQEQQETSKD